MWTHSTFVLQATASSFDNSDSLILGLCLSVRAVTAADPVVLQAFNGRDLTGFYVYLGPDQPVADQKVFSVTPDGWLRISGEQPGYLSTKESLRDFRLEAEFKWGRGGTGDKDPVSDSGIFFHAEPADKLWARSLEVQLRTGATGDLCLIGQGAALQARGRLFDRDCIERPGKGNPQAEVEKPHGEWNRLELVCHADTVQLTINDKLLLSGNKPQPAAGRIYFQSYQGELFYRKLVISAVRD